MDGDEGGGVPHPSETEHLIGQSNAEDSFLSAFNSGRLHHAWLITGPKGIGKATLAYRIARFLLSQPEAGGMFAPPAPQDLASELNPGVVARVAAGSEPGLFTMTSPTDEKTGKVKTVIPVDEVRRMKSFFAMSAGGNGRRVVIVDAADDLNTASANALLKVLEEPPDMATLILVAHQPGAILPTIRSRVRQLACHPLNDSAVQTIVSQIDPSLTFDPHVLALAQGSVGRAMHLLAADGLAMYQSILAALSGWPRLDRDQVLTLANSFAGPGKNTGLFADLFDIALSRIAQTPFAQGTAHQAAPGEMELARKLCPDARASQVWASFQSEISVKLRHGFAVNLDQSSMILDSFLQLEKATSRLA